MSDELLRLLASKAGIDPSWRDQTGEEHRVSPETLRALLAAIALPAWSDTDLRNSLSLVESGVALGTASRFLTARIGQPVVVPNPDGASTAEIEYEHGPIRRVAGTAEIGGMLTLPPFKAPGYHKVRLAGVEYVIATAPARCRTIDDLAEGQKCWGVASQIYSLPRKGDCGNGDFGAIAKLARATAALGADLLAISPVHALFPAEPRHFSPYSPSSRLHYNPAYADPGLALPPALVAEITAQIVDPEGAALLESADQIDWQASVTLRQAILSALFLHLRSEAGAGLVARAEYEHFRLTASPALLDHCAFEILHAHHYREHGIWHWRQWPADLQHPGTEAVKIFVAAHREAFEFQLFQQWVAGRAFAECQRICRESGMRVGLIADMAIGLEGSGSDAWCRQGDVLGGLTIGAPPDRFTPPGQNWGLTTFSPRALVASGFAPFLDTLRASMRHAGGIRLDHVMGMNRLWIIPEGGDAAHGAYMHYPSEALFRLIALESRRHDALVIGEDLGTLPDGFREYLHEQGIAGLRVLRFERDGDTFRPPEHWDADAAAMTTTHDIPSSARWWRGTDIIEHPHGVSFAMDQKDEARTADRQRLWSAFTAAGTAEGEPPRPEDTGAMLDAAMRFIAATPSKLRIIGMEDALGLDVQPNLPGTVDEHPNWRHRLPADAADLPPAARERLAALVSQETEPTGTPAV